MRLEKTTATDLIREISGVIDYDINIMDETGNIIASTDHDRVGQFHEGAHLILHRNLPELLVYYDEEYCGCKKGINLPIMADETIIGVIGITGEVSEINQYARLIKKVTDILMKDLAHMQQKSRKDHAKMLFINSWFNGELEDSKEIEESLRKYHIRPDKPMAVVLVESKKETKALASFFESSINSSLFLTSYNDAYGILIGNFESAEKAAAYLNSCFEDSSDPDGFTCAIGPWVPNCESARISYKQAQKLLLLKREKSSGIFLYDDCLVEILLNETPKFYKEQLSEKVFRECTPDEVKDFADFIALYCRHDGSINSIAKATFVHKNTVQYKINKIISRTGLDLRRHSDFITLYLAGLWHDTI